jgi:predicted N-formylglutamate amidohydrolase
MQPLSVLHPSGASSLVLTCEHASCAVPVEYDDLGLDRAELEEHIGWDIGARYITEALANHFDAAAILAGVSRLVIDCNRDLADHDLIVAESHGVRVPGNARIDADERQHRIREFYEPYHEAIDGVLASKPGAFLLSVHSFTPSLNGRERRFDVGVLFDLFAAEAQQVGEMLTHDGLAIRYNEPYSGLDGLIFSARSHGTRYALRYLEIEVNNHLVRDQRGAAAVAAPLARAIAAILES